MYMLPEERNFRVLVHKIMWVDIIGTTLSTTREQSLLEVTSLILHLHPTHHNLRAIWYCGKQRHTLPSYPWDSGATSTTQPGAQVLARDRKYRNHLAQSIWPFTIVNCVHTLFFRITGQGNCRATFLFNVPSKLTIILSCLSTYYPSLSLCEDSRDVRFYRSLAM